MRKCLKIALEKEQIEAKNKYDIIDAYEIHLYGDERDHFELWKELAKPITTIHYPLARCDVAQVSRELNTEYFTKVMEFVKVTGAGLVLHAESPSFDIFNNPDVEAFCKYVKENGITIHVENCYRNIGAVEALQIMKYMRNRVGDKQVYPLLDICHLIMSEMSFKYEELSFFQTLDAYKSKRFKIHFNDCIGSGEVETGGIHGTNFSHNQYLLNNVLWKLFNLEHEGYPADLILEVEEKDYIHVPDAIELAKNIDKYWKTYTLED